MKIQIKSNLLKNLFKDVYFINGTAYAGKSTMIKLLADQYDGIWCGENYNDEIMNLIDDENQPNLFYVKNMKDWQEFISRTPDEYNRWIIECGKEATDLEMLLLIQYAKSGKKIFVDTNMSPDILKEISDYNHVLFMLAPPEISVNRFFEREDKEKQFIYQQLLKNSKPEEAMANFRECLKAINSKEHLKKFKNSGFKCIYRDDSRNIMETLVLVKKHFMLD